MVLTDRQRKDLHTAIYDYLTTHCPSAAEALAAADPDCTHFDVKQKGGLLEKKWTAIPRLQKKVLELERAAAQNKTIHAHRTTINSDKRMLPRLPCKHTLQGHAAVVSCVEVHPVFTVVASGSEDGTIKIWDHESGDYMRTLKGHTNAVTSVAFSPTGAYLVSSSTDLSIKLWDFTSFQCVRTLRGHDHTISAVKFLLPPSSDFAFQGNGEGLDAEAAGAQCILSCSRDETVKVWDVASGFCEATLTDHTDWVRCSAVSKTTFCTSGSDAVIYVYDATVAGGGNSGNYPKIQELRGHEHVVESLAFAPSDDGTASFDSIVSGGRDRTVRLWKGGQCLHVFDAHENWVRSVIWHPSSSGNYIISAGDDRSIRVLDIKAQRCLRTLDNAHPHFVTSMSMHHTLPILVSGSVDTTLKCWALD